MRITSSATCFGEETKRQIYVIARTQAFILTPRIRRLSGEIVNMGGDSAPHPGRVRAHRDVDTSALTASTNGSFAYAPNKRWAGIDEFDYKAGDGMAELKRAAWSITVK